MKRRFLIIATAFFVSVFSHGKTAVGTHGKLSVSGNRIVNESGEVVSFAGGSFFWSNNGWGGERWYRDTVVDYVQEGWNATIVRAAMGVERGGGYLFDPAGNQAKVEAIVDAAIDQGIYVIIDWHTHYAEDYESEAIAFFSAMASQYGNTPNVIYEIYNEPLDTTSWANDIKPYSENVISAIRSIDPDNLIVVGTSTWSQDVHIAAADPIAGYDNLVYALHFYAGTHTGFLRTRALNAMNSGIALMVTEWGTVQASGDGAVATSEANAWVQFMRDNDITHCNWALNDKNEGASVFKTSADPAAGAWTDDDLTDSGSYVKNVVLNWDSIDYEGDSLRGFEIWLQANGLPIDSSPFEDSDGNGLVLLIEYALGFSGSAVPEDGGLRMVVDTDGRFHAEFAALRSELNYRVLVSSDFSNWTEAGSVAGSGDWVSVFIDVDPFRFVKIAIDEN